MKDAVEYGTGEKPIEMGNEMEKSLDKTEEKKENQLDRLQHSSE